MIFRQNHDHHAALEYRGNKKDNDFVTMGKNFCIQIFKYVLRCLLSFVIIVALAQLGYLIQNSQNGQNTKRKLSLNLLLYDIYVLYISGTCFSM
jgi:hypothetical protein